VCITKFWATAPSTEALRRRDDPENDTGEKRRRGIRLRENHRATRQRAGGRWTKTPTCSARARRSVRSSPTRATCRPKSAGSRQSRASNARRSRRCRRNVRMRCMALRSPSRSSGGPRASSSTCRTDRARRAGSWRG
jgi:hypothetical protein